MISITIDLNIYHIWEMNATCYVYIVSNWKKITFDIWISVYKLEDERYFSRCGSGLEKKCVMKCLIGYHLFWEELKPKWSKNYRRKNIVKINLSIKWKPTKLALLSQ